MVMCVFMRFFLVVFLGFRQEKMGDSIDLGLEVCLQVCGKVKEVRELIVLVRKGFKEVVIGFIFYEERNQYKKISQENIEWLEDEVFSGCKERYVWKE